MNPLTFTTAQAESTEPVISAVFQHLTAKFDIPTKAVHDIPWQERYSRIATGRIDIAWVCGSYYTRLVDRPNPPVELLAAPIMVQARYQGRPVYYSDVVVRNDSPFQTFAELEGATCAYNEPGSVSGYWTMRYHLAQIGESEGFFGRTIQSGTHVNSLQMVLNGEADTAAIDSMVMSAELQENPEIANHIRVVEVLGPTPVPPWIIRRSLPEAKKRQLRQALLALHEDEDGRTLLQTCQMRGFTAVADDHYDPIRQMMLNAAEVAW